MDMQDKFLVLDWNKFMELTIALADQIQLSGYMPDVVVAILRGGYFIAKLVCDILDLETIATLEIKFYKGVMEKAERPIVIHPITFDLRDKKTLIVDDVADSGRTLQVAMDLVRLHGAKEVRTATLFFKPWSITMPDYYVEQTDKWIVFPWELGETLRNLSKELGNLEEASKVLNLHTKYGDEVVRKLIKLIEKVGNRGKA